MSFSVSDDGRHALINVAQQVKKIIFLHFSGGRRKSSYISQGGGKRIIFLHFSGEEGNIPFLHFSVGTGILLLDFSEGRGKLSCYISQGRWKTSSCFISHEGWENPFATFLSVFLVELLTCIQALSSSKGFLLGPSSHGESLQPVPVHRLLSCSLVGGVGV